MEQARRYQLLRNIASGGMAQVHEAKLIGAGGFERRVALKRVLPQHAQDPTMRRMFFDEARLAGQLHHGNIVQIIDFGVVDECEFIAMEYVDGIDAGRALDRASGLGRPLPDGVALHIVAEAAHALHYAHQRCDEGGRPLGIVHRDVSPQNILLSWQGDVKLGDFGIALARGRQERTRTGVVKGKQRYMAPEQAMGRPLTAAADIYALGVTLQALAAGNDGLANGYGDFAVSHRLARPVARLVARCTDPLPEKRPSAGQVAEQAGRLAAARLARDGRGALADWLVPLRQASGATSKLDDLMGLSLVPLGPHVYTVSRAASASSEAASPEVGPSVRSPDGRSPSKSTGSVAEGPASAWSRPEASRRGARWPILAAVAVVVAAAAVVLFVTVGRSPDGGATGATGAGAPGLVVAAAPPDGRVVPVALPATPDMAAAPVARDLGVDRDSPVTTKRLLSGRSHGRTRHKTRARSRPRPRGRGKRPAPAPRPPTAIDTFGWIRVGGAALAGGRVSIDGQAVGYAPLERRIAAGSHAITVRDPASGRVLLQRRIAVGEHHSRERPVRLIVRGEPAKTEP